MVGIHFSLVTVTVLCSSHTFLVACFALDIGIEDSYICLGYMFYLFPDISCFPDLVLFVSFPLS